MKKIILTMLFIALLLPLINIIGNVEAYSQSQDVDVEIGVAINTGNRVEMANQHVIERALDGYLWIVNDTSYNFTTERIDYTYFINDDLYYNYLLPNFEIHIIDGFSEEIFYLQTPNLFKKLKTNIDDFIFNHEKGYIGRCAGVMLPAYFYGNADTITQYNFIEKTGFLSRKDIKVYEKWGFPATSQMFKKFYGPFFIRSTKRWIEDPGAVGEGAYEFYGDYLGIENNEYKGYNIPGICVNITNLNKIHPILKDYFGNSLYTRTIGGPCIPNPPSDVDVLAYFPEEAWDTNLNQDVKIWRFTPLAWVLSEFRTLIGLILSDLTGMISIEDIPPQWQNSFLGREEVSFNELFTVIIRDWGRWTKTCRTAKTEMQEEPCIVAFDYGAGRIVLSAPHTASNISADDDYIVDMVDNGDNSILEGLYRWKKQNGDIQHYSNYTYNEDLYWYQRREAAWVSGEVSDFHLPPVYGRSHVIDIKPIIQENNFTIECIVGKESEEIWDTQNLSLFYKWFNQTDNNWTNWTYYDSVFNQPYYFIFNVNKANGSGKYEFCSILKTTFNGTVTNDEYPPQADAWVIVGFIPK